MTFNQSYFKKLFLDLRPDLFFKIYKDNKLVKSTESTVLWNYKASDVPIVIEVSIPGEVLPENVFEVKGTVRLSDGFPAVGVQLSAFDRYLRNNLLLGQKTTDNKGYYSVRYDSRQLHNQEKGRADLVVKAFDAESSLLAASQVLFNAPPSADIDLTIPDEVCTPLTLIEKIVRALDPLLEGVKVEDLEEDDQNQDLSFLSGETGFTKNVLVRFVLAHNQALQCIQPEFWFVLLGGSLFDYREGQSLAAHLSVILGSLSSVDGDDVRKALTRSFNQMEILDGLREKVSEWVDAFLAYASGHVVSPSGRPTFTRSALDHAGIQDTQKPEKFSRLLNEFKILTPELLLELGKDESFKKTEIADLRTSFRLSELTQGDFSVVKMLKEEFDIREPEKIRTLARMSRSQWVNLVKSKYAAGDIKLPFEISGVGNLTELPNAEVYGKVLERQFREAFPTTSFTGGLGRALENSGPQVLKNGDKLLTFLEEHEDFELHKKMIDDYFKSSLHPEIRSYTEDKEFRREIKAVLRVFKLAPNFEATDALLSDDLHSAQKIYRLGESAFDRRYVDQPGFTAEGARRAWNRASDTFAAVVTVVSELNSYVDYGEPLALQSGVRPGGTQGAIEDGTQGLASDEDGRSVQASESTLDTHTRWAGYLNFTFGDPEDGGESGGIPGALGLFDVSGPAFQVLYITATITLTVSLVATAVRSVATGFFRRIVQALNPRNLIQAASNFVDEMLSAGRWLISKRGFFRFLRKPGERIKRFFQMGSGRGPGQILKELFFDPRKWSSISKWRKKSFWFKLRVFGTNNQLYHWEHFVPKSWVSNSLLPAANSYLNTFIRLPASWNIRLNNFVGPRLAYWAELTNASVASFLKGFGLGRSEEEVYSAIAGP